MSRRVRHVRNSGSCNGFDRHSDLVTASNTSTSKAAVLAVAGVVALVES